MELKYNYILKIIFKIQNLKIFLYKKKYIKMVPYKRENFGKESYTDKAKEFIKMVELKKVNSKKVNYIMVMAKYYIPAKKLNMEYLQMDI